MINKTLIALIFAVTSISASASGVAVSPIRAELNQKMTRINLTNHGDTPVKYTVEKSDDWMLVAPAVLVVPPKGKASVKVGRKIDKGQEEIFGRLKLKSESAGAISIKVIVPAAGQ